MTTDTVLDILSFVTEAALTYNGFKGIKHAKSHFEISVVTALTVIAIEAVDRYKLEMQDRWKKIEKV